MGFLFVTQPNGSFRNVIDTLLYVYMGEEDTNRIAVGKPRVDMASSEGGNASENF